MLRDEYKLVATIADAAREHSSQAAQQAIIHALWKAGYPDTTMCGQVEALNIATMAKNRIVNCPGCLAALKKVRQQRSRAGTAQYQERMREQRDQVEEATAGYERAPELGPDMAWVPTEEIDRILVSTMQMRAVSLRQEGNEDLAADLEIAAGRLAQHAQIEDADPPPAPVNTVRYIGTERRHRPRMVEPTIPDDEEL